MLYHVVTQNLVKKKKNFDTCRRVQEVNPRCLELSTCASARCKKHFKGVWRTPMLPCHCHSLPLLPKVSIASAGREGCKGPFHMCLTVFQVIIVMNMISRYVKNVYCSMEFWVSTRFKLNPLNLDCWAVEILPLRGIEATTRRFALHR